MKIAHEGYPFILITAGPALLMFVFGWYYAGILCALLSAFMLYFFRDPERITPGLKDVFIAPADGKVIVVRDIFEGTQLNSDTRQVSIFMSPLNVHVNRAPCGGTVKKVEHKRGSFLAAYKDEASVRNEHIDMVLDTAYGDVLVRQVAGFVARRAVCRKAEGELLAAGERYGMIKFSSRVDIYMPKETSVTVGIGDVVKAGETVIGTLGGKAK